MVQAMTEQGRTRRARARPQSSEAENVAVSRQIPAPTVAVRHAEVIGSAVYAQSGPSMAALAKKNTEMSKQMPKATMRLGTPAAEQFLEEAATP